MAAFMAPYLGILTANSLLNFGLRHSETDKVTDRMLNLAHLGHELRTDELAQAHRHRLAEQSRASEFRSQEIVISKYFDAQAQARGHDYRLVEQDQSHQLRLEEQLQASQHRCREIAFNKYLETQTQARGHDYRLIEQGQTHEHRLSELAFKSELDAKTQAKNHLDRLEEQELAYLNRLKEIEWSSELQLYRDLQLRSISHRHTQEIEQIRSQYAVQTAVINRRLQKFEENSPFLDASEQIAIRLKAIYLANCKPLVLIAPFWDDSKTYKQGDEGGLLDYRVAMNVAWQKTQWFDGVTKCDGYLKRPLRYTDRDIAIIASELADIPIILVHGMVQAGQRVHPAITIWNVLPGQENSYFHLYLESFDVQIPKSGDKLEFQDYVAHYLASIIGILGDAHHLILSGKRPQLSRYAPQDAEKLKLLAEQFGLYYDLICFNQPLKEPFYRLDQSVMLHECGFTEEAKQQIVNSIMSWYYQKTRKNDLSPTQLSEILSLVRLASVNDAPFFIQLAETYRIIGMTDNVPPVQQLLEELKKRQLKLPDRFKR